MKVLITGSNGQLGLELSKQLDCIGNYEIIKTDRENLNILDFNCVNEMIINEKPDVVINCAAHTAVDVCETDIENAYKINALGPRNLAIACEKVGSKFVQVSTDYVFDGSASTPYREDDITCPNSIYGASKLMGENFTKDFCSRYFIVRTAWLYGEGNNFVRTMIKLSKEHKELNVVNDQFGSPTSTVDLAKSIIDLMQTEYYGTYHGTCEGQCSWYDLAKKIFEMKNIDIKVNPVTSEEFKRPAPRPAYSVLDNFMLKLVGLNSFRNWEKSLEDYLKGE
ncbi:dtdp-4-dehydrorhamnose reductase,dTDP-4-dehydrorhamnose reductase,dTDP-4-dehydrorhamnose reductase,dTDP-4-dehydrorhamnose reductase,RmlD substrate binding domain [[Clostridium] sordellii]|uniref:dTDP-4-dehydrorhamnose reductase n=1 Tax=Paraclostridium sordellii TaxID=1505 RepID=UPI000542E03A|nr:dTDP-4-dehydrorhamnose reductase [Paeniclostridium sordellii]CEK35539.1 dtdp-4-dehydrorhamnose reductase,dTDP-4-dehydrorhamnose reductase,dTDP-4-dehydrorhamnose reductase,dTDP-4-dehydrorhamnose reductase,RmlD substrate binding domain [[Clostridium] sordellii] [Paeniclostridium sordellii]